LADRQINAYLVTQDIDSLIGPARITAGEILRKRIQEDADRNKLGVQVVFAGLIGVHPPSEGDVANAFQQQIEVLQQSQTKIEQANQIKIMLLAAVAGSLKQADEITAAIKNLEASERDMEKLHQNSAGADKVAAKEKEIAVKEADIEELLASAQGQAAEMIYKARAYRWEHDNQERAKSERFEAELAAYQRAPELYRMRRYLEVLTTGMADSRKYVLNAHSGLAPTLRLDLKDSANAMSDIMKPEGE
jgi:regulator of protease activity HflC (stomatin/prohibitin superfamily)